MGLPLTVYPGTYTPGAETALHAAVDVINETWAQGNTKLAALETKIEAVAGDTGFLATVGSPHVTDASAVAAPAVTEPAVNIPTEIDTDQILTDYAVEYGKLRTLMVGDLQKIFTDYFPEDSQTYGAAETWIQGALANPNGGLPVAVQAQLLTDEQDRLTKDAARASDAVMATFAARRFPMPPGAAAGAVLQIQQNAQDKVAEASRKITVLSVDMMKFAVEKALTMRQAAIGAALEYVKALASAPSVSSQVVGMGLNAQSQLITAASSYYNARIDVQKLVASVSEFNVTAAQDTKAKNQAADMAMIENKLKALLTEIQAFAQIATSLFNNLHASSGTGYNVSVS